MPLHMTSEFAYPCLFCIVFVVVVFFWGGWGWCLFIFPSSFPGHAIEAGWFLLQLAQKKQDAALKTTAIDTFIKASFQRGWDAEHGGIFYFLDVDGESPVQLEWDMKLWWPHCEALIAFLMAYTATGDRQLLQQFATVFDYSYSRVRLLVLCFVVM